ncbi:protein Dr1 homolog [Lycium barbarum]|uniref:protein Dr1 homolog n=1 Tax=Lycium barbarum TaxID=112863 RepID=UPI00293E8F6C|nr:protein Dr1 homolog [Lycium barbarum]
MEPMDIVGKTKEDASLPKATMTKIIKEMLPPDVRVARDTQDLLIECCVEFINLISSESNEVCNREERRTIAPEHVLKALEVLGFGEYIEEVYAAYEQHRLETVDTVRAGKCSNGAEMTEEEALAEQQRMFAEARVRMNGGVTVPSKQPDSEVDQNYNNNNIPSVIPQVGSGDCGMYAALPLPCEGREAVSNRPSASGPKLE